MTIKQDQPLVPFGTSGCSAFPVTDSWKTAENRNLVPAVAYLRG